LRRTVLEMLKTWKVKLYLRMSRSVLVRLGLGYDRKGKMGNVRGVEERGNKERGVGDI